jgi:hypothetical protein
MLPPLDEMMCANEDDTRLSVVFFREVRLFTAPAARPDF